MKLSREIGFVCGLVGIALSVGCGGGMIEPTPISVRIAPANPSVAEGGTLTLTADVMNDPSASGVSWSILEQNDPTRCVSPDDCGETSASRSASGTPITFTAGFQSVHLKATSAADATKSATTPVIIVPSLSSLTGTWTVKNAYQNANLDFVVELTEQAHGSITGGFSQHGGNGSYCWEPRIFGGSAVVAGKRDGDSVALVFSFPSTMDFGPLELDIDGTLSADKRTITGTFSLKGSCSDPTGTSILTRQ